ncbi:MAG: hypothetical protein MAG794_00272 [Gammaproteobacteria bacterium]|nr:hypothetical protein [Gammaproteobacteria bacterium]
MKRVYTAAHLPDAHLFAHSLETHGVRARVFNETLQGGVGELPHIYPEVWIEDEGDWDRARSLVRQFERDVTRTSGVNRCPKCQEDNPSSFEICWQCGAVVSTINDTNGCEEGKF